MIKVVATDDINAVIVLADGTYFLGKGVGSLGQTEGEICFNTGLTGYQETLTDPSYAGQIITFTFPHLGNVGCNELDNEARQVFCKGLVIRNDITSPSNFRSEIHFNSWLLDRNIIGISNIDTRALTIHIRDNGPQHSKIVSVKPGDTLCTQTIYDSIKDTPNLTGVELTQSVTTPHAYDWNEQGFQSHFPTKMASYNTPKFKVVAIDYGIKHNILRCLTDAGFAVTVVPATASYAEIITHQPDGIFLSNGPGDPWATAQFAVPVIQEILANRIPIFGICLGNQLLSIAASLSTTKMNNGHRGSNQPVQDISTKKVYITSQNHGFCVTPDDLPATIELTHLSLFDGSVEGIRFTDRPAFSVQFHPESSPGPHDCRYLFEQFSNLIVTHKEKNQQIVT